MSDVRTNGAVFFDVDGVLIDSVGVKGEAFADVFEEYPEHRDDIIALHAGNAGIPRGRKFEMIHERILGVALTPGRAEELRVRFATDIVPRIVAAPEIAGASATLRNMKGRHPLHAISAVPRDELEQILEERGSLSHFRSVHGTPPSKSETVTRLLDIHDYIPRECVFVGDGTQDFTAAQDNGVPFIHVVGASADPIEGASAVVVDLRGLDSVIERVLRDARE